MPRVKTRSPLPLFSQVLFGRGLGAGPTLHLAALAGGRRTPCAGVLLQSPYLSPAALLVGFAAAACLCLPGWDPFGASAQQGLASGAVACPVCVVHGADDEEVPLAHGQRAHRMARNPYLKGLWLDM